jgi:molybdopterin synthase catalytic subunit
MQRPASVRITTEPLRLEGAVEEVAGPAYGAIATFTGTVRDRHRGRGVRGIEYHAYAAMAEQILLDIGARIERRHGPCRVAIHHRIGPLAIGDASVVIAVAAPHRREALAGCAAAIDLVKAEAPIWKKELYADGACWIEGPEAAPAKR